MEPRPEKGVTGRPRLVLVLTTLAFAIIVLKLWSLQIVNANKFREMGRTNMRRTVNLKPERGRIFDRNGLPLATRKIRFDACVDYDQITGKDQKKRLIQLLSEVLSVPEESIEHDLDPRRVIPYIPTVIKREITRDEFVQLKVLEAEVPGLHPEATQTRYYPYGDLACHVLGYTGAIPAENVKDYTGKGYLPSDIIGISGIEKTYENELRGQRGRMVIEVDNKSRLVSIIDDTEKPVDGNDICLTIDLGLQTIAEKALGDLTGAIVIVDPRNGDVLAMASKPSFDPSMFTVPRSTEDTEKIRELLTDNVRKPALNRAISNPYPLGSAFKVVTALAALSQEDPEKAITRDTIFNCPGYFTLGRRATWRCYHGHSHGEMNVVTAIKKSCNVFFYNVGYRAGRDALVSMARKLGLGELTGIALPNERPGVNPTDEWLQSDDWRAPAYRPWVPGFTVNMSIGQYPIEVTPIQVAMMYSVVANGGTLYRPRLVKRIVRPDGDVELRPKGKFLGISQDYIDTVKEGLGEVTKRGGTAYSSFSKLQDIRAAGKTSTAEPGRNMDWAYTWFVSFAPIEDPEILVVVLVEKGRTGGSTSAPIAADILQQYFADKMPPPIED